MPRLSAEAYDYNLRDADLYMKIGRATFIITAYNGDVPGVLVAEDVEANVIAAEELGIEDYGQNVPTISLIAPKGALLYPNEFIKIGRECGIEVFKPNCSPKIENPSYRWGPLISILRADDATSRYHALVKGGFGGVVSVMDFGSLNGTLVEPIMPDESL